jgi:hypothetical protein
LLQAILWFSLGALVATTVTAGVRASPRKRDRVALGAERRRSVSAIVELLANTHSKRATCERAGLKQHVRVLNTVQFVVIWNGDLSTLLDQMAALSGSFDREAVWRRHLVARTLALTAYEALTKMERLFNPEYNRTWSLRRAVRELSLDDQLDATLNRLHSEISSALTLNQELLEGIRNNIIGHRDQDASRQLEWIERTNPWTIERLGWRLLELTSQALGDLDTVTVAIGKRYPLPLADGSTTTP